MARGFGLVLVVSFLLSAGCSSSESGPGPEPPTVEHDWEQLHRDELARLAAQFEQTHGQPPPTDVEFVRFIDPAEFGRVLAQCVRDQGFQAEETFDGGVTYEPVPDDQVLALEEAIYRCDVAYPVHPRYLVPLNQEQIRKTYDYWVTEVAPCLTAEGYDVSEPPSWETFLASHNTSEAWTPYAQVDPSSEVEWRRINEACPQHLPPDELFGTDD